MNHWLIKTEPGEWSWADQNAAAGKRTTWSGVRNPQAMGFMKQMAAGDLALFYHTGKEKAVVGLVEIVKAYAGDGEVTVDVKAVKAFKTPVSLASIKADKRLAGIALVRQSRLSVMPIDGSAWAIICKMGGIG